MLHSDISAKAGSQIVEQEDKNPARNNQNNPFSSPSWFADEMSQNDLSFIEGDGEIGFNAMHVKTKNMLSVNIAELAGEPFIQYNDMLKHSSQPANIFLDKFVEHLKFNNIDALHLHNVRQDAHIFEYCRQNGSIIAEKKAAWLDLTNYEDFDGYLKSINKNTRYKYNRLPRQQDCLFETFVDAQITAELVTQVIAQKSKQLELRGETSRLFSDKTKLAQLVKKLTTPSDDFQTYVTTLKINGELASSTVVFLKNNKIHLYILAMDDDFSKLAPGNHIILENIRLAFQLNCIGYDFLAPEDAYKLKWSKDNFIPVYDILVPITHRGRIFGHAYLQNIRPFLKKIYLSVKKKLF